ncbi:MAG: hypothetical protein EXS08_09670 [Planctomycetes bacterium]|nr:hypothetical protein [Planctomycetota bacterium]
MFVRDSMGNVARVESVHARRARLCPRRVLAAALRERGGRVEAIEAGDGDACAFWRARLPGLLSALFPPGARAER